MIRQVAGFKDGSKLADQSARHKGDSMSRVVLPVLSGPNLHELSDAFKYAFAPNGKDMLVDFRLGDAGRVTGFSTPIMEGRVTGLQHVAIPGTILLSVTLTLKDLTPRPVIWRVRGAEYTYTDCRENPGVFELERVP